MLKSYMSNTDFHKYDNRDVLGKVLEVRDYYKRENKQLMINYSIRDKESEFHKLYAENSNYSPSKYRHIINSGICCYKRRWL